MELEEKSVWNQKYREKSHTSLDPDPLLVNAYEEFLSGRPPGSALDLAGGVGRHSIWLAQRGWRARLIDISDVGVAIAKANAAKMLAPSANAALFHAEVADLNQVQDFGKEQYDLIMVFFYLQRELFPAVIAALKPGGLLLYKTYTTDQEDFTNKPSKSGPSHPMFLLKSNELLHAFQSLRVLHYRETIQGKGVAELVARK